MSGMSSNDPAVEFLLSMEDDHFRKLVDDEIRVDRSKMDARQKAMTSLLRSPQVVERWWATLRRMQASITGQIESRRADADAIKRQIELAGLKHKPPIPVEQSRQRQDWLEIDARFQNWLRGSARFKTGLEERMIEVELLRNQILGLQIVEAVRAERNELLRDNERLRTAIRRHHEQLNDDHYDPSEANAMLWNELPEIRESTRRRS